MAMPEQDDATRAGDVGDDLTRAGDATVELTRPGDAGAEPALPDEPRPVSRGRYRLGTTLGEGGMAIVLEAEDVNLKRPVAIKQLRDELRHDAASRQRFFAEAEILAGLEYAGVVPVHDAGLLEGGGPYYAMARVKGPTLADLLKEDAGAGFRVSMRHVDILLRAAETVGHAHGRGLMHLDLKPQNIMVDEDGAVYVMDWGIARRTGIASAGERGVLRGTPAYMSPEVAAGRADTADARSDVFALGVMLYEILTGQRPFRGDAAEVLKAIISAAPPEPRRVARHVPRELAAICMKALSKDPAARYHTARELASDLRDFRSFLPVSAYTPTIRERAVKWMRRHPRATTAMATAVMALVVFGSIRAYRLASERAMLEAFWVQHQSISSDLDRLEAQLATLEQSASADGSREAALRTEMARAELHERIELRANDARSVAVATLGLTRGRPDPRLVQALSVRLRHDVDRARASGDFVRVKVLAETRLALLDLLQGQIEWPEEERMFLQTTLEQAKTELERRLSPP